jgi:quercetin dioxygenase-like cupin family protein/alkylhydroperoxidase/carboxymuconolactone decarboxylase family protein YurZ
MKRLKIFLVLGVFLSLLAKGVSAQQLNTNDALNRKQQSIIPIAAFTAKGYLTKLQEALNNGLDAGLSINEAKEVLVHLYAYAGFPRSLNAISTLEAVVNERKQKGINDVQGRQPSKVISTKNKFSVGKEVQTKLMGSTATGAPQRFAPIIDTFLKEHLFADIFSRDILDWKNREIATISALASLGGVESQLRSHFNVALNTGLTEEQLKNIVSVLQTKVGDKEGKTADLVLQSVLNKTGNISLADSNNASANTVFPKGTKISNNNFTGTAWLQMLVTNDTTFYTSIGNVTFEPGARTAWHYHPGGQILLVTSGKGRYGEKGKPVRELRKGDVIKCDPNIIHWHGAAPGSEMSHLAIGTNPNRAPVVWLQRVSDEEYNNPQP